ncbi:hypothetical protein GGE35_000136 [Rhizobium cellulosilyticum]|uniref:Arc family DNA-binding protein n=1 Tax=Aliirhizobium cellulosilyticum TaxID=393664 RepID=A0A7W6T9X9_9HYPH|nr:hypothetical protein [Rhizobium cellulosilyticum]MBB4409667.1 hypothetical protein [Rhizobium cellulosilyticum]MBB4444354.1 hypothetical protein [Rhizobium cellulosilyticum]
MTEEDHVRITIVVPSSLRKLLKVNAAKNDRSFSGEIVRCLKVGSGWDSQPQNEKSGTTA